MEYAPLVQSATRLEALTIGDFELVLLGDVVAVGAVQYEYLVAVYRAGRPDPVLYVAAELNTMDAVFGGGSHFLGVFDDDGHHNYGASDRWGDRPTFLSEAERIVRERFDLPNEHGAAP